MDFPEDLFYTKTHEWAKKEGDNKVRVGITSHAQSELGDVVYIELPDLDRIVKAGTACTVVESVKAAYDIMINGSKVAGYAARKSQGAVLCQGYLDVYERWEEKYNGSHEKAINLLFDNLAASFKDVFGITLTSSQLTEEEMRSANEIRDKKYACDDWNYRK